MLTNPLKSLVILRSSISLDILTSCLLYVRVHLDQKQKKQNLLIQKGRFMNITYLRSIAATAVACAAGLCLTTSSFAATVNLDSTVQNGNFEGGLTDWSQCCSGSPGASTYTPSPVSTYYSSGIPGGGTAAMYVPVSGGAGSGYVVQDLGVGFTSGTTYTVDVYVAMPLITQDAPGGLANHLDQTVINAELVVDNGGGLSIPGTLTENVSFVNAAPSALGITSLGTWELITLSATATGTITGDIGLELGASMNDIDQPHQVDFVVGTTPLPGAVWLFGSVLLGGLGLLSSRKRRLHVPVSMIA